MQKTSGSIHPDLGEIIDGWSFKPPSMQLKICRVRLLHVTVNPQNVTHSHACSTSSIGAKMAVFPRFKNRWRSQEELSCAESLAEMTSPKAQSRGLKSHFLR